MTVPRAGPAPSDGDRPEPKRDPNLWPAWDYPQAAIASATLRALMTSERGKALFQRFPKPGQPPDDDSCSYRATAFWPHDAHSKKIFPFLRCQIGGSVQACDSGLSFGAADRFAGEAWSTIPAKVGSIGTICRDERLKNLHDCGDDIAAWQADWQKHGVPPHITQDMGKVTGYASKVRSVACVGVKTAYGDLILCIDSVRSGAFHDRHLAVPLKEVHGRPPQFDELLTSIILSTVVGHVDFWTWLRTERSDVAYVSNSLVPAAVPLLKGVVQALAPVVPPELRMPVMDSLIAEASLNSFIATGVVLLFVCFFGLLPDRDDISRSASEPVRKRIATFVQRWSLAWLLWFFSTVAVALGSYFQGEGGPTHHRLADPLSATQGLEAGAMLTGGLLAIASSFFVLSAYLCINRLARDPSEPASTEVPSRIIGTTVLIAVSYAFLFLLGRRPQTEVAGMIANCLVAVFSAASLCLLIGRLDSRLIGTPGWVIGALYVDAIAHAFCAIEIYPLDVFVRSLRLPLDLALFTVVVWMIRGRALERYLTYIGEVAGTVPRTTFRQVFSRR